MYLIIGSYLSSGYTGPSEVPPWTSSSCTQLVATFLSLQLYKTQQNQTRKAKVAPNYSPQTILAPSWVQSMFSESHLCCWMSSASGKHPRPPDPSPQLTLCVLRSSPVFQSFLLDYNELITLPESTR